MSQKKTNHRGGVKVQRRKSKGPDTETTQTGESVARQPQNVSREPSVPVDTDAGDRQTLQHAVAREIRAIQTRHHYHQPGYPYTRGTRTGYRDYTRPLSGSPEKDC